MVASEIFGFGGAGFFVCANAGEYRMRVRVHKPRHRDAFSGVNYFTVICDQGFDFAPPAHGFVRVQAYPWAHVWIDGRDAGTTPLAAPLELVEGPHTFKLEHDWYQPIERQVDVKGGRADNAAEVTVDFEAQGQLKLGKARPAGEETVP